MSSFVVVFFISIFKNRLRKLRKIEVFKKIVKYCIKINKTNMVQDVKNNVQNVIFCAFVGYRLVC